MIISPVYIPVIALSANAIPRDIEMGLNTGFFRYLTKPIKVHEFMDALDVVLRQVKEHDLPDTADPADVSTGPATLRKPLPD